MTLDRKSLLIIEQMLKKNKAGRYVIDAEVMDSVLRLATMAFAYEDMYKETNARCNQLCAQLEAIDKENRR